MDARIRVLVIVGGLVMLTARASAQTPSPIVLPPVEAPRSPIAEVLESPREEGGEERREERDEIETDRDSFTPAITTVGRGRLVIESAYSFIDNRRVKETHSFPELLFRYGITERIELRLGWNCEIGGASSAVSGSEGGDFESGAVETETIISYGVKLAVTKQDRWLPASVLIATGQTPTSGENPATELFVTYGLGWAFLERWKFDTALRFVEASDEGDRFNVWAPSAVIKVNFWERWDAHVEYFGGYSVNKAENFDRHFVSPGLHYLITENFEVGARVGWGLSPDSPRFFANAGVGLRF
jgi:hypothetical protein